MTHADEHLAWLIADCSADPVELARIADALEVNLALPGIDPCPTGVGLTFSDLEPLRELIRLHREDNPRFHRLQCAAHQFIEALAS